MASVVSPRKLSQGLYFIIAFVAASMTGMSLGISWYDISVDGTRDFVTITDLSESKCYLHPWSKVVYDECLALTSANQLGSTVKVSDCQHACERDSCADAMMRAGHAVSAFTIITFIFTVVGALLALFGIIQEFPWSAIESALFFLSFVTAILAWAPFVGHRYGALPYCNRSRDAPWCSEGATSCRFFGFGFMAAVTVLNFVGFVVSVVFETALRRQNAAAKVKGELVRAKDSSA